MSDQVPEVAQVGTTLELEADTLYPFLSSLIELRIYYKQARGATLYRAAAPSSGAANETKMLATLPSELNVLPGKMRTWAWGRGAGTILFKGRRRFIQVDDPETA